MKLGVTILNSFIGLLSLLIYASKGFAEDIRDVKPPVYFPPNYFLPLLIVCLVAVIGIIWLAIFLKKKNQTAPSRPVETKLPWEIAYAQLEKLLKSNLLAEGHFKVYYSQLSDIVRQYAENQFRIRAPEMTTEEFLWSLDKSSALTSNQKNILKDFLDSCDMVKFAKYVPNVAEAQESCRLAKCLIEETKLLVHGKR